MAYQDYIRQTPEGYIRVVNSADYDNIVSYTLLPDITVFVDAVVNIPNTVQATFKSGKVETMIIKWERVNVDTSTAGTQKIYGDIGNGAAAVLQNVIVNELSDLDILRQIRDANPTSQLPSLWLDIENPYTQWEGIDWITIDGIKKVWSLTIVNRNVSNLNDVSKLKFCERLFCQLNNNLASLNLTNSLNLKLIDAHSCNILNIYVNNSTLETLLIYDNKLTYIPTITSKGNIYDYNFTYNNMPTTETNRLIALGFDSEFVLPQNP